MLSSPCIPRRDSLLENSEVLLICHRVSLLFECCSHYMALEGTLQGRIAWLVPKGTVAIIHLPDQGSHDWVEAYLTDVLATKDPQTLDAYAHPAGFCALATQASWPRPVPPC